MNTIQTLLTDNLDIWTAAETEKKSGRGRSSGNAASVYGIKKLRELILELAVRGKLVPQDANDEHASELLKRIQAEKAKLIAEGKIKISKPLAPFTKEEKSFDLPHGWELTRLADLVNVLNGRAYKKEELLNAGTPVLRVGNLFTSEHWYYSDLVLEEDKYCNKGDLLFAWSASFGPFIWDGDKAIYHYHIWKLNLYGDLLYKRYLYTFLLEQTQKIKASGHGVMLIHMTKEKMEKLVVYLPPVKEQHRIVAKVDELMALCDQLETQHNNAAEAHEKLVSHLLGTLTQSQSAEDFSANWQRIAAHFNTLFTTEASIDVLKQTLLQLAVMGKLVPQDANDEPASELLKRIQAEKAKLITEGKIKKDKPLAPITEEEKPFDLPQGWEWVRFGSLVQSFSNGLYKPAKFYTDQGIISLRMFNIQDGSIDFEGARRVEINAAELDQFSLDAGDLLINRVNSKELVGKTAIIPVCNETLVYESMNMRARTYKDFVHSAYLNLYMKSNLVKEAIFSFAKEAISQASINQTQISSLSTPLPPLAEQHRIVAKVDELMAICDQLKSRISKSKHLQQKLADVMVEQAIS